MLNHQILIQLLIFNAYKKVHQKCPLYAGGLREPFTANIQYIHSQSTAAVLM